MRGSLLLFLCIVISISGSYADAPAIEDIVAHQSKLLTACLNSHNYDTSPIAPLDSDHIALELELASAREELCNQYKENLAEIDHRASVAFGYSQTNYDIVTIAGLIILFILMIWNVVSCYQRLIKAR